LSLERVIEEAALLASEGMSFKGIAQYLGGGLSYWQVARLGKKVTRREGPVRKQGLRSREKVEAAALAMLGLSLIEILQVTGFNADATYIFLTEDYPSWRLRTCLSCHLPFPSPEVGLRFCLSCRPGALRRRLEAFEGGVK